MDEANIALGLLGAVVDWAIGEDCNDCITGLEYSYGMTLDEAFNILDKLTKEE